MNRKTFGFSFNSLVLWIPLAIVTTALCGIIYVAVQQNMRLSANDPQIELAEDVANELTHGLSPKSIVPPGKIDISKSLANFIIVFDNQGKLIGSSATIEGQDPVLPKGVFDTTKAKGETRFTWQPKQGVRSAVVVTTYKGAGSGFVLVGRSLKEVELRIDNLGKIVFLGWIITMLASFVFVYSLQKIKS